VLFSDLVVVEMVYVDRVVVFELVWYSVEGQGRFLLLGA